MSNKANDRYSERESKERFEAALRGALNTPAKPLKSLKGASAAKASKKKSSKPRAITVR